MTGPTVKANLSAKNRQVTKWLGFKWYKFLQNPDFVADPLALLRLMRKREDWDMFVWYCYWKDSHGGISVPVDLILDTTGMLLEAVYEWLKKNENDPK